MIRDTACLRGKVSDVKTARTTNTLNYKSFPGGHLTIAAAGSPGNLAALPIRYLLCDEIDKYPASAGAEGDPLSLAAKRQATFWNRKSVLCCSPTVDGESRIQKAYQGSDRRQFYVNCHVCGEAQSLEWRQVKWNNDLPAKEQRAATAHYECEHCHTAWNDVERSARCREWPLGSGRFVQRRGRIPHQRALFALEAAPRQRNRPGLPGEEG